MSLGHVVMVRYADASKGERYYDRKRFSSAEAAAQAANELNLIGTLPGTAYAREATPSDVLETNAA